MFFGVNCFEGTKKCEKQSPLVQKKMRENKRKKKPYQIGKERTWNFSYLEEEEEEEGRRNGRSKGGKKPGKQNLENPINIETCTFFG